MSVEEETHRLARIRAAETGTTVSAMMRDMLLDLLRQPATPTSAETERERRARLLDEVLQRFRREGIGGGHQPATDQGGAVATEMRLADTNVLIYAVSNREADAGNKGEVRNPLLGHSELAVTLRCVAIYSEDLIREDYFGVSVKGSVPGRNSPE